MHEDEIAQKAEKTAALPRYAKASFGHHCAEVRAGRVSVLDLETLQRVLGHNCVAAEHWLAR